MAVLWLLFHFALTLQYSFPLNPIKIALHPLLERVVDPYFFQNWRLFAPNPINHNRALLVACADHENQFDDRFESWLNISAPLWAASHRHFVGGHRGVSSVMTEAVRLWVGNEASEKDWTQACALTEDPTLCEVAKFQKWDRKEAGLYYLKRIGSSFCGEAGWERGFVSMVLKVSPIVAWYQRFSEPGEPVFVRIASFPIQENLAPSGLFNRLKQGQAGH